MSTTLTRRDFLRASAALGLAAAHVAPAAALADQTKVGAAPKGAQTSGPKADASEPKAEPEPDPKAASDVEVQGPVPMFDLHCDTLDELAMRGNKAYASDGCYPGQEGYTDLGQNKCAVSLERMEGFNWCQCFAVWVPDEQTDTEAAEFYTEARDFFYNQINLHADRIAQIRDARDIDSVIASGKVAAMLTVENGKPVGNDLKAIERLAEDGVKMVTLTWNGKNAIGSGHTTSEGLSAFGKKTIPVFEDSGVVVDVSHLNDAGLADLLAIARKPFAASHSNSRALCNVPRNLTDDQFRAIRDAGGIVGLNFYNNFVTSRDVQKTGAYTFEELVAHAEHFLDLDGADTLCLGSDWDGSEVAPWLHYCDSAGDLYRRFVRHFDADLANKIFFTNARDFFVRNETL